MRTRTLKPYNWKKLEVRSEAKRKVPMSHNYNGTLREIYGNRYDKDAVYHFTMGLSREEYIDNIMSNMNTTTPHSIVQSILNRNRSV